MFGGEISYNNGTYGSNRVTADVNLPLNEKAAVRINSAYTTEESFQDAGFSNTFFLAPSIKYEVNDKLTFLVNTEFYKNTSAKSSMIFLSRYAPLSFDSMELFDRNYKRSFTSNDLTMNNNRTIGLRKRFYLKVQLKQMDTINIYGIRQMVMNSHVIFQKQMERSILPISNKISLVISKSET